MVVVFFFFFSSRRRHTRSKRDWSSDVCSSDLLIVDVPGGSGFAATSTINGAGTVTAVTVTNPGSRSEERRVGKSVDLGGRRIIKKKKKKRKEERDERNMRRL